MKIGVIIPTRGTRPEFLENNNFRNFRITTDENHSITIFVVDEKAVVPVAGVCDITKRYRAGYEYFRAKGMDILFFAEDDDYYHANYVTVMLKAWEAAGRPDMFGTYRTIYYNLKLKKYFSMNHDQRSSAMNMMIKPDLDIVWPEDHDPFTDQWLWMNRGGVGIKSKALFLPDHIISFGIKHGIDQTGGGYHVDDLDRYINDDPHMWWIDRTCHPQSAQFYKDMSRRLNDGSIKQFAK